MGLSAFHLFAGGGGGILADILLGHRTVGAVEIEAYPRKILLARQLDGSLPQFPIWDDVRTFRHDNPDTRSYIDWLRERREELVICGGFPCQDISSAGKGAGIEGERSGLWGEMARIIGEVRPRYAFIENSPMLTTRGLGRVLADLAGMGFDAKWGVLSCADVGGIHLRKRIWIVATNTNSKRWNDRIDNRGEGHILHDKEWNPSQSESEGNGWKCRISQDDDINDPNIRSQRGEGIKQKEIFKFTRLPWGEDVGSLEDLRKRSDLPEPIIRRIGHDVAFGVDRLKAIGNGQVSRLAATAWKILNAN